MSYLLNRTQFPAKFRLLLWVVFFLFINIIKIYFNTLKKPQLRNHIKASIFLLARNRCYGLTSIYMMNGAREIDFIIYL